MAAPAPRRPSALVAILIVALALALGGVGWAFGADAWRAWTLARDAPGFVAHEAVITRASTRQQGQDSLPDIRFRYTIDGRSYEASNADYADSFRDAKLASRQSARYRTGQTVIAFIDPVDPSRAALARTIGSGRAAVRAAYAALFFGAALLCLIGLVRSWRRVRVLAQARARSEERQRALDRARADRGAP